MRPGAEADERAVGGGRGAKIANIFVERLKILFSSEISYYF
jgi:hypothetical protein